MKRQISFSIDPLSCFCEVGEKVIQRFKNRRNVTLIKTQTATKFPQSCFFINGGNILLGNVTCVKTAYLCSSNPAASVRTCSQLREFVMNFQRLLPQTLVVSNVNTMTAILCSVSKCAETVHNGQAEFFS